MGENGNMEEKKRTDNPKLEPVETSEEVEPFICNSLSFF